MTEVIGDADLDASSEGLGASRHPVPRAIIVDRDVADGLAAVAALGPDGRRWKEAWVLVRVFTEPIAFLKIDMPPGGLAPAAIAREIERCCLDEMRARFEQAQAPWTGVIPVDGIAPPRTPAFVEARERAMRSAPSITVAICTHRRPEGIARILESLVAQSHPPTRVLIVDNAPPDPAVAKVVEEFRDRLAIDSVEEPREGLSWARNRAIEASDTEVIAFLDDDERCDPWWLAEIARGFVEHPAADAVSGVILPAELDTPAQWWFESYGGHSKHRGLRPAVFSPATRTKQSPLYPLPPFGSGGNMAFRRSALDRIGWFDVALGAGTAAMAAEDTAALCLVLYAGGTVVYQPSALVFHTHLREREKLARVFVGYGRGLTAFYASVLVRHPRSLLELLRLGRHAVRDLTSRDGLRLAGLDADFPEELLRANLRGLAQGPWMYAWARLRARPLRARDAPPQAVAPPAAAPSEPIGPTPAPPEAAPEPLREAPATAVPAIAGRRPIKVMTVEVDECPDEISAVHPAGGRYDGLWLLARVAGEPRALIRMQFTGDRITRAEIEPRLRAVTDGAAPAPPAPAAAALPRISVIVCSTFERLDGLRRCLESLVALEYPNYEIVVVDNRPGAGPLPSWLATIPQLRLLHEPQPGLSAARNCGLAAIDSEIVAFTDDDVVVDPGWLRAIGRRFVSHPDEVCVTGLILPAELETSAQATFEEYYGGFGPRVFQPVTHRLRRPGGRAAFRTATVCELDDDGHELSTFLLYEVGHLGTGANMAFRTKVLREAGGFDIRLGVGTPTHGGEDVAMFVRLIWRGHSLGYDPAALVYHSHRRDDEALRRQVATFGTSFTATMIALTLEDPRHVGAIVATLPQGIRRMGRLFRHRLRTEDPDEPVGPPTSTIRDLARLELTSMTKGPAAYVRSRRRARQLGR